MGFFGRHCVVRLRMTQASKVMLVIAAIYAVPCGLARFGVLQGLGY